ncbi:uncharacterized protein LOC134238711 [Saccostrea cucullata]|uniref:uncharacterized protein LOC134238711 n=1 Tax=Saccostrea cuccullata TaxID=36930 RepID=UPI002ED41EB0
MFKYEDPLGVILSAENTLNELYATIGITLGSISVTSIVMMIMIFSFPRRDSLDKEKLLLEIRNWLTTRHKKIKVVRLFFGVEKNRTSGTSREVIVLVIDDFKVIEEETFDFSGKTFPIICKLFKFPPLEGAKVTNIEQGIECNDALYSKFRKCIRDVSTSKKLFEKHSNLEIISASSYRSKKNGDEIVREPCIVLYCSCKGVIPFKESEFPETVNGMNTDVREGFFYQFPKEEYFTNATDVLNPLTMGASISSEDFLKGGTLGGFVSFNTGDIGFITCAHVLFDLSSQCHEKKQFNVVQPAYSCKRTNNICGIHHLSCFPQTPYPACTLDVSLVKLTSRIPDRGLFSNLTAEDVSILENGYNIEEPLEYSDGSVRDFCENHSAYLRYPCFKIGAKTGFTRGKLHLNGISVKCFTDPIDVSHTTTPTTVKYYHQLEILGEGASFSLPGDSGALVFQLDSPATKGEQYRIHCIGMIVGATSDFKTVVTPIGPILKTLGVKMYKFDKN